MKTYLKKKLHNNPPTGTESGNNPILSRPVLLPPVPSCNGFEMGGLFSLLTYYQTRRQDNEFLEIQ